MTDLTTFLNRHDKIAAAASEPCSGAEGTEGDCMECLSCAARVCMRLADHNTSAAYRRFAVNIACLGTFVGKKRADTIVAQLQTTLDTLAIDLDAAMGDEEDGT